MISTQKEKRTPRRVLGVDACKKGWFGLASDLHGYFASTIDVLVDSAAEDGKVEVVAIDIPIGLPIDGPREADKCARALVGKRASSVFTTPIRATLSAADHGEASALSRAATGVGLSRQAFALRTKILEVDRWAGEAHYTVIEVHPEVSFATMAATHLKHPKSTWAGAEERRKILADVGIVIPGDLGDSGANASSDDVLDAAAAMWTAQRYVQDQAGSHPDPPQVFGDGHLSAIWA